VGCTEGTRRRKKTLKPQLNRNIILETASGEGITHIPPVLVAGLDDEIGVSKNQKKNSTARIDPTTNYGARKISGGLESVRNASGD
jgi:hypothetical protein